MGDQAEHVVLEAEDNVTPITAKSNAALENFERKATSSGEKLVRINDQTRTSVQRLIASLEKQTETYGKSGVEKLIAQRDQLLQRYQREPAAIDAITRSYQKMIDIEVKAAQAAAEAERKRAEAQAAQQRSAAGQGAMGILTDPLGALRGGAVEGLTSLGTMGGVFAGVAAGLAAVTAAGFEAAKSLGEYGMQIRNVELRTGLTSKEVGQFSYAARMAGQDVSIFERMMRGLAQAEDEQSKEGEKARATLARMGVDLRAITGDAKPTSQVMLEIAAALEKLPEGAQRDAAAMDLFKRAGIEAIPVISGLTENVKRAKELGLGATEEDLRRWEKYHQQITEAEMLWERFTRKIKEPLAAVVTFLLRDQQGRNYSLEDLQKRGVNLGQWAPRTAAQNRAAAAAAGFTNPEAQQWEANITTSAVMGYTGQIEARRQADAAVAAYQAQQGLQGQLKKAEEALRAMPEPKVGVSSVADIQAYEAAERKVESLKNQIEGMKKASEQLSAFRREAAEFEKKGDESELDAIGKIWFMRDQLLQQATKVKASEADIAAIRKAADEQVDQIVKKNQAAFEKYDATRRGEFFASPLMLQMAGVPTKEDLAEQKRQAEEWQRAQERIYNLGVDTQRQILERRATAEAKQAATPEEAYQVRVHLATQLAQIEVDRIQKEDNAANRAVLAAQAQKQLKEDLARAQDDLDQKRAAADAAHQAAIQAEVDAISKVAGGLFHTLFTKPQEFPKQLLGHVREAVLKPVTEGLGGITGQILQPVTSQIGSAFKGVFHPAGKDDVKTSTDHNTAATDRNSAQLATLTALLASLAGVSVPSVAAPTLPGGGSLPSITAAAPAMIRGGVSSIVSGGFGAPAAAPAASIWGGGVPMAVPAPLTPLGSFTQPAAGGGFWGPGGVAAARPAPETALGSFMRPGGGFSLTNLRGSLGNLQNFVINPSIWNQTGTSFGAYAASVLTSPAATTAGMMLGTAGLLGGSRGTWGGIAMGTIGGALTGAGIGAQFGPMGALIGAGAGLVAGFGIGLGEKLAGIESPQQKAHDDIRNIYGVDIPTNSGTIKQVVSIAQSQFGGDIAVAVRSPSVRQLVMLYSEATGQKTPLSAATPYAGSLVEQGGQLYQQASFQNNAWHTFASALPTLGGITGTQYPTTPAPSTAAGTGVPSIALNINGTPITAGFVADQSMAAQQASYGRTQMSANMQVPGLMVG